MTFIKGLFYNPRTEKQPEFIKGNINIKVDEFKKWLEENKNEKGYVRIDFKESKDGKHYAGLNTWKPENKDLPF